MENRPVRNVQRADEDAVCLFTNRESFDELRRRSDIFDEFCSSRLSGLLSKVNRQVQAEAVRDLGDSSLNIALSERPLRPPVTASPTTPIAEVLRVMSARKIGSMIVTDGEGRPIGIFTLKDLMNRVVLSGVPVEVQISQVMTPDPVTLPRSAFAFEAAMAMAQSGIRHICVVEDGRLVGVISERDLFSMQRVGLVNLSKSITAAVSTSELASLAGDIGQLVAQMIAQGVKVGQVTQIITLLNDQIVERVIALTLADMEALPVPFTWVAFGSEGRREQTLKTDQDNGILFVPPDGVSLDEARTLLLPFASKVNVALDVVGFPLCLGNVMARNPECCLSAGEWRARFQRWIGSTTPENLLSASIYFDLRAIWGPHEPVEELRRWLLGQAGSNGLFRRQMAANALRNGPPLGLIRDFRLSGKRDEANTLDLKLNGVTPFIDAARILALGNHVPATGTVARLEGATQAGGLERPDAAAWIDAYDYIRMLRMRLNEEQAQAGGRLTNRIDPARLNDLDRSILRESLREARRLQARLRAEYQL